jgi:hypothetical protein
MRVLSSAASTLITSGRPIGMALLIEMHFQEGSVYMNTGMYDLEWNDQTWVGLQGIGSVAAVDEAVGELQPLRFTLMAGESQAVAMALGTPVQGRPVRTHLMILDPATHAILDVFQTWTGTLDQMTYEESFDGSSITQPSISVTAEHRGVAMTIPIPARYTDADQQKLHPGDKSLEYVLAQSQANVVWPAASYFKQ